MGFATSQQINKYYAIFKNSDITFTREVVQALHFNMQQVTIRIQGEDTAPYPCVIHSASMISARIIVTPQCGITAQTDTVSVRFSFFATNGKADMAFFVAGKITDCESYTVSPDLLLVTIEYTQKAPDNLIEKLGTILDAKATAAQRCYERIVLTPNSMRKMALAEKETVVYIDSIPRRCILRDISLSGAKFIVAGVAAFLINKVCVLKFTFEDPFITLEVTGIAVRMEVVEGRKDLVAIAVNYNEEEIPLAYQVRLAQYFSQQRKVYTTDDF